MLKEPSVIALAEWTDEEASVNHIQRGQRQDNGSQHNTTPYRCADVSSVIGWQVKESAHLQWC